MRFDKVLMAAAWAASLWAVPAVATPTAQVALAVSPQRSTRLTTWVPKTVRGVVLFSTGHGSWPEKYDAVASAWKAAGFAVIAPLHVDSVRHPDQAKFTRGASFGERIADMKAASAYATRTWPGKPIVAAGHSFGTLTALCLGGGLSQIGDFRDPSVKAVLGFSSPGRIPGLVGAQSYATDSLPVMIVTGDRDVVPGLVTDWHDHLLAIETSPAGAKYALVYTGGAHELIGHSDDANFATAVGASTNFLRAYALGDVRARKRLGTSADTARARWIRR